MNLQFGSNNAPMTVNRSYSDDLLNRITYKEHIKFYWQADALQVKRLVIEFNTIDSYHPDTSIKIVHNFTCPWTIPIETNLSWPEEEKINWIFECILKAERHEAREFFKVDGEVFDPPGHGMFEDPYR